MKDLNHLIQKVEDKWLNKLFGACKEIFSKTLIPSHDQEHHKRVWKICKEIITELSSSFKINEELLESCIIASFFHDTGLTKTLSQNHGFESKMICLNYFEQNKLTKPANFIHILEAIEKHDDKEYKNQNNNPESLVSILCAADDLDAFGRIGVVRYTEIYLLRGLSINELPSAVIENINKRFAHFESKFIFLPELYKKYKDQYLIARDFFNEMSEEIENQEKQNI